jgi:hypothetical protein
VITGAIRSATQFLAPIGVHVYFWSRIFVALLIAPRDYGNVCWWAPEMIKYAAFPVLILSDKSNSKGPTSPSGAGGAASSALSLGLDDGTASPAASLLASEAAALVAYVTLITNTRTEAC